MKKALPIFGIIALLLAAGLALMESFVFGGKILLYKDIGADSLNIYFPYFVHLSDTLRDSGLAGWSWSAGMGQNIFVHNSLFLTNPVVWVPQDAIPGALAFQHIGKCLIAGLAFFGFLHTRGLGWTASACGALGLAFGGYLALGACWLYQADEAVAYAVLLLAVELALARGRWWVLPPAVAWCAVLGPMALYPGALLLVGYTVFRGIELGNMPWRRPFWGSALPLAGAAGLGVLLAMPLLFESLLYVFASGRGAADASPGEAAVLAGACRDHALGLTWVARFFGNDLLGTGSGFSGWANYLEAPVAYCGLAMLLLVPQAVAGATGTRRLLYLAACLLLVAAHASPAVRLAFWGFQSEYFRTLSLFGLFLLLTLGCGALDAFARRGLLNLRLLAVTLLAWTGALLAVAQVRPADPFQAGLPLMTGVFLWLAAAFLAGGKRFAWHAPAALLLVAALFAEVVLLGTVSVAHRQTLGKAELAQPSGYNDETRKALDFLAEHDPGFYRVQKDYSSSPANVFSFNDALVFGHMGTSSYSSFNQPNYVAFLTAAGAHNPQDGDGARWVFGTRGRPLLQAFCAEKYVLTKNPAAYAGIPFFTEIGRFENVAVFENRIAQPFARAHSVAMAESEFLRLSPDARATVLLNAAVVPDAVAGALPPAVFSVLRADDALPGEFSARGLDTRRIGANTLGMSGALDRPGLLVLPMPLDENWVLFVNGDETQLFPSAFGLTGALLPAGDLELVLEYSIPSLLWSLPLAGLGLLLLFLLVYRCPHLVPWVPSASTSTKDAIPPAGQAPASPALIQGRTATLQSSFLPALILIFAVGVALRLVPSAAFEHVGFDEHLYRTYVATLEERGLMRMPEIVGDYLRIQTELPSAILPPTRFLYIFCGYLWSSLTGMPPIDALHDVSAFFSILMLGLSAVFAYRLGGARACLGVTALMACAPMQIHMAQHALIDGFFAFWALLCAWLLWENLRAPDKPRWLLALGAALGLMVLTKENAFFVYIALLGLVAAAPWLGFGRVTRGLLAALFLGPLAGLLVLVALAGGPENFFHTYLLLVEKAYALEYAIKTGDGPWFRYLVDLLLASPLVLLLTVGAYFRLSKKEIPACYLAAFIAFSYLIMCNIKYGMNLRYTNMWDMPMRYLAFGQLVWLAARWPGKENLLLGLGVGAVCLLDLRQYKIFFMDNPLYELVTEGLLRALWILK